MSGLDARLEEEARWTHYLDLMGRVVGDLVHGYAALGGLVARGSGSGLSGGGGGGVEIPAPIRLEVVDAGRVVDVVVDECVPLVRGALRMGLWSDRDSDRRRRTVGGLRFLGSTLRQSHEQDPELGNRVTDSLWGARKTVAQITGEGLRPFRLHDPCAECGERQVWVEPGTWKSRCAACGAKRAPATASLVFSVSTP